MFEDKAIPNKPYIPGSTSIKDKDGADIILGQNKIAISTLGNTSSILLTTPINISYPSNNFTTFNTPTVPVESVVIPQENALTSSVLPKTETPEMTFALRESNPPVESPPPSRLPDIEPGFAVLFDDGIREVGADTDYTGLEVTLVEEEILAGRATTGTYVGTALSYNAMKGTQKANFDILVAALKQYDFTPIEIKAIVSIASKESGFVAKKEQSYRNTDGARIKSIFKSAFKKKTVDEVNQIKKNDKEFWDYVYGYLGPFGKQYGHTKAGDGEKYLGRGFNGITFKTVYQATQKTYAAQGSKAGKVDIVADPYLLERDTKISAHMTAAYFINARKTYFAGKKFGNLDEAILYYIRANAGWGISLSNNILQEGLGKAKKFGATLPETL